MRLFLLVFSYTLSIVFAGAPSLADFVNNSIDKSKQVKEVSFEVKTKLVEKINGKGNLGSRAPNFKLDQLFHKVGLKGKRVMDLGCGLGGYTLHIAKEFEADIVGVDPEKKYIDQAQANQKKLGSLKGTVDFRVMNNRANLREYATNSFDIILAKQVFFEVKDKSGLIREVKRVLKPRGLLIMVDLVSSKHSTPKVTPHPTHSAQPRGRYHAVESNNHINLASYNNLLQAAELELVEDDDITDDFTQQIDADLQMAQSQRDKLESEFGTVAVDQSIMSFKNTHKALKQHELEAHIIVSRKSA